jgi:hypothetical protein
MQLVDNHNTVTGVDHEVACNVMGPVAKGVIREIKPDAYNRRPIIKVELLHDAAGMSVGHISTVRSSYNLLVLYTADA